MEIIANLVDVANNRISPSIISIENDKIKKIDQTEQPCSNYILPPFVDSHIHIESSMLVPSEFARIASIHGTVAVVSDPHEIANVLGIEGIRFFIENANSNNLKNKMKFFFGVPSCVPATDFETSGAKITPNDVRILFDEERLTYLGEMMNFPGVINDVPDVIEKIRIARDRGKVVDGHCPRLTKDDLQKYISAGISTDHECTNLDEATEKIQLGMKIQIRNGSSAKDFDNLFPLIDRFSDAVMFASDDLHTSDLLNGHINLLVKKAVSQGANLMNVLKAASLNPINHYKLDVGKLQVGDDADFVIVDNLKDFNILQTYCCGKIIAENGKTFIEQIPIKIVNNFKARFAEVVPQAIAVKLKQDSDTANDAKSTITSANIITNDVIVNIIEAQNGLLVTERSKEKLEINHNEIQASKEKDILKLVVLNRYEENAKPSVAFVRGFGITNGAIATSIAHDSHNIIAVGSDDESICNVMNAIIFEKGGIAVYSKELLPYSDKLQKSVLNVLPLPVAGLMSDMDANFVARENLILEKAVKNIGTKLDSPFMTLSFMALLVIPKLKLSDKGLFNVETFSFEDLIVTD